MGVTWCCNAPIVIKVSGCTLHGVLGMAHGSHGSTGSHDSTCSRGFVMIFHATGCVHHENEQ